VSAPLQAFVFSSYLLNVLLQLANKNGIKKNAVKIIIIITAEVANFRMTLQPVAVNNNTFCFATIDKVFY
jgi:hypothetical protein